MIPIVAVKLWQLLAMLKILTVNLRHKHLQVILLQNHLPAELSLQQLSQIVTGMYELLQLA